MNERSELEKSVMGLRRKTSAEADERILADALAAMEEAAPRGMSVRGRVTAIATVAAAVIMVAGILIGIGIAPEAREAAAPVVAPRPGVAVEERSAPEAPPATVVVERPAAAKTAEQMLAGRDIEGLLRLIGEGDRELESKVTAAIYLAQIGDLETAEKLDELGKKSADKQLAVLLDAIAAQIKVRLGTEKPGVGEEKVIVYSGTVADESSKAIENVIVRSEVLYRGRGELARDETETITDAVGKFEIAVADSKEKRLVVFDHPRYAFGWWQPSDISREAKITLFEPREIAGKVVSENGRPVAGAKVSANIAPDRRYPNMGKECYLTAVTDAGGRFVFDRIFEDAKLRISVTKEGYARYVTAGYMQGEFAVRAGDAELAIVLGGGGFIAGQLVHKGKPFEKEGIIVDCNGTGGKAWGITGAEGKFEILGLAPGAVDILIANAELAGTGLACRPLLDVQVYRGTRSDVQLELAEAVRVTLQLVNGTTGEGVTERALRVRGIGAGKTNEMGQWRFTCAPGEYVASTQEWTGARVEEVDHVFGIGGGVSEVLVEIGVSERPMIRGILVDEASTPVDGMVYLGGVEVRTRGDGIFEIAEPNYVEAEMYVGYAFSKDKRLGRAFLWRPGDRSSSVLIDVGALASVVGRVVDANGEGIEELAPKVGIVMPDGEMREAEREWWQTITEGEGWFRIDGVPTGVATVLYFRSLKEPGVIQIPAMRQAREVDVGQIVVDWMGSGGKLTEWDGVLAGVVVDQRGRAVVEAKITAAIGSRTFFDYSGLDGGFAMTGLPRGERVSVSVRVFGYVTQSFEAIIDGEKIEVVLVGGSP